MSWLFPRGRTSLERFRIAVQRTRVLAYLISGLVGGLFVFADVLPVSWPTVGLLVGLAYVTAFVFVRLAMWSGADRMGAAYDWGWLTVDALFITLGVHATGGISSPWFIWYLANVSGAAFVLGQRGASAVAALDCVAYLSLLALRGEMHWLSDEMYLALARMAFLYAASFLFFRGASLLRRKRNQVEALRAEEARKLEDLTRLTAALDQRTRELEVANLRIREADRLKSQFLATMSHELRTPLNSIIGFSEILQAKLGDELTERYRRFLTNINSSGHHLLEIINNILDLSKIEAGRMEMSIETVDIPAVVEGVLSVMQPTARERDIRIITTMDTEVTEIEADPVKLKQILFNLLANAVKYSPDDGEVTVRVQDLAWGRNEEKALEISVIDHGIGIDPANHRLIFDEFRQVDGSATRSHGGTGLGLALVRRLVSLHRGAVAVDSELGKGATFTVTLPVAFTGDNELRAEPFERLPEAGEERSTRILVVEDDPSAYEVLARHLSAAGYLPIAARTGMEAVDLARRLKPAAITLDVILPEVDGWETLRQLKADSETSGIPVVMVSMLQNRELALALGAADYFTKPVDGDALVRRLTELVPLSRARAGRLLLVDDDPDLHELVRERLAPRDYALLHAMSGREGLETAFEHLPDLVLLDLMMDEMDGFEVAARLKEDRRTQAIPIVVLTAKEMSPRDRDRLRGKIEALVEKLDMSGERLGAVIGRVLEARSGGGRHARS